MVQLFGKKKDDDSSEGNADAARRTSADTDFRRNSRKAASFFKHAQTVADSAQWDYAIDLLISGLRHDPDNMTCHDQLRDIALRRKASGGKPAGMGERLKSIGKDSIAKMLDAQKLWAKDPFNAGHVLKAMEKAADANEVEDSINMGEVAYWLGERGMEINDNAKKVSKKVFIELCDQFARVGGWDKAVECAKKALSMSPDDDHLVQRLRDLEAEESMARSNYGRSNREKIEEKARAKAAATDDGAAEAGNDTAPGHASPHASPHASADEGASADDDNDTAESGTVKRGGSPDAAIKARRAKLDKNPEDGDLLLLLVDALAHKQADATDKEAVALLKAAHERTGEYRFKKRMGDITMKWMARHFKVLKEQHKADPDNEELKEQYKAFYRKKMNFELGEYTERSNHRPSDAPSCFEMAKRLKAFAKIDDAIAALQQVQNDPRIKAPALILLGQCYEQKGWLTEAVDARRKAAELYPGKDIPALTVRYALMEVLEKRARADTHLESAQEAEKIASEILQTRINFKDIADRLNALRTLVAELRG